MNGGGSAGWPGSLAGDTLLTMKMTTRIVAVIAAGLVCSLAAACGQAANVQEGAGALPPIGELRVETVVEGLEVPWAIVWLPAPDGRMLITERPGRVRIAAPGAAAGEWRLAPEPIYRITDMIRRTGEIGLMDLALHPRFSENRFVYLAYGHRDNDVRIVRYRFVEEEGGEGKSPRLEEERIIIKGIPAGVNHAGCRIAFGPDGKMYITTGEAFRRHLAQDKTSLGGKTLRLNDDGGVPEDNPFASEEHRKEGWRPEIWTLGHRNAQGIDWHPVTGLMYQSEHGPSGEHGRNGDELNLVERGKNYGWPTITHMQEREGLVSPLVEWTPAIAPASGMFYKGGAGVLFPALADPPSFLVGGLRGMAIVRIVISPEDPRRVLGQERLFDGKYGRIREIAQGPDGAIYFSTSNRDGRGRAAANDDRILRVAPAGR
jgi:aldose sugar dehydrogenase